MTEFKEAGTTLKAMLDADIERLGDSDAECITQECYNHYVQQVAKFLSGLARLKVIIRQVRD